jgi:hypothetical protein
LTQYIGISVEIERVEEEEPTSTRSGGQISNGDKTNEAAEEAADEYDDDEEYDDAILFLPTGFSRPKPKTYYRGSDPEWQEFRKVALDRPRVEKIRSTHSQPYAVQHFAYSPIDELTAMIRNLAQKNPTWNARLGTINTNKGKSWIELKFPDGPPVEYERPGIELTEDLEWRKTTRPVEDVHHQRLNKILFPTEVSKVLYQDAKRKAELSWKSLKAYMGWEETPQPETIQSVVQRVLANPPSPPTHGVSTATTSSPSASAATESKQAAESDSSLHSQAKALGFVLPDPKKLTLDLTQFRQDFRKTVKPYASQPPRGAIMVLGMIEVYGDRARITLNVTAAYDPKEGRYVGVKAGVWNLVDHSQSPKGGP